MVVDRAGSAHKLIPKLVGVGVALGGGTVLFRLLGHDQPPNYLFSAQGDVRGRDSSLGVLGLRLVVALGHVADGLLVLRRRRALDCGVHVVVVLRRLLRTLLQDCAGRLVLWLGEVFVLRFGGVLVLLVL